MDKEVIHRWWRNKVPNFAEEKRGFDRLRLYGAGQIFPVIERFESIHMEEPKEADQTGKGGEWEKKRNDKIVIS